MVTQHLQLRRAGSPGAVAVTTLAPRTWKGGAIVIWTHPAGQSSLFGPDGATPVPAAQLVLDRGAMVVAPDVFLTGAPAAGAQAGQLPRVKNDERFPAFNYGYNRALLAERVRDLLTTVAFAKTRQPRAVHLVAFDRAGVWALLSRALAGDAIARASIDLDGFDFAAVQDPFDPMMLPGAVKYGGVGGMLPLVHGRADRALQGVAVRAGVRGWPTTSGGACGARRVASAGADGPLGDGRSVN